MTSVADLRRPQDAAGWSVLDAGLQEARLRLGPRLEAAFAIGSLAHGGFAPAVSDVDLALVLSDLDGGEADEMGRIRQAVQDRDPSPLAARLSIFWSSWRDLEAGPGRGRFPAADWQDLKDAGLLLIGEDRRDRIQLPTGDALRRLLVIDGASFMLARLADPRHDALIGDGARLLELGCRETTKTVLFPARFLYTAAEGRAAGNVEAVQALAGTAPAAIRELVAAAYRWRTSGVIDDRARALDLLEAGLLKLYLSMIDVYRAELEGFGDRARADELMAWAGRLSANAAPEL